MRCPSWQLLLPWMRCFCGSSLIRLMRGLRFDLSSTLACRVDVSEMSPQFSFGFLSCGAPLFTYRQLYPSNYVSIFFLHKPIRFKRQHSLFWSVQDTTLFGEMCGRRHQSGGVRIFKEDNFKNSLYGQKYLLLNLQSTKVIGNISSQIFFKAILSFSKNIKNH